jgi:NTE family protein
MTTILTKLARLLEFLALIPLLLLLQACAGSPPNIRIPHNRPPDESFKQHPRVVLVLGGGGARGYAHLGVIKVLEENGIPIDALVTCSAGSIVGALYADQGDINKAINVTMNAGFWDFADLTNSPTAKGGFMQGYHLQKFLLANMRAQRFDQLRVPLIVATTDLKTGETFPIDSGPIPPAVNASSAIPGIIIPVHLYNHILVDGGTSDLVPVDIAESLHPQIIIAVDVSRQLNENIPTSASSIFQRANIISWGKLARYNSQDANIVIRPDVGDTGVFDIDEKASMIQDGEIAALKALPAIQQLMKEKNIKVVQERLF